MKMRYQQSQQNKQKSHEGLVAQLLEVEQELSSSQQGDFSHFTKHQPSEEVNIDTEHP
jgi:hypothetical protein